MRLLLLLSLFPYLSPAANVILTLEEIAQLKQQLRPGTPLETNLRRGAEAALKQGPWTVTAHRPSRVNLPANEYYSEAPYFWPDPAHPGKMLRKDGERYPDRFDANHRDMGVMSTAVLALGAGAWFFDDERYARKAAEDIAVWFEDPKTRMNPELDHAQAVVGQNEGRPTGIIDTASLIRCAQGMALLEASGKWDATHVTAAKQWMADYLQWLLTSKNGKAEARSGNNHATWWTAQVAALATYTGNEAAKQQAWAWLKSDLIRQIEPNGACPREEARTTSLHYSCFDLDAFATLCRLGTVNGVDLWQSGNLPKAFHYIAPFVIHPESWTKQQISPFNESPIFVGLAGTALPSAELMSVYAKMRRPDDVWNTLISALVELRQAR